MSGAYQYSSDEAEHAVLGVLLNENAALQSLDALRPEQFTSQVRGRVFAAITDVIGRGRRADPVTVGDYMASDPDVTSLGGKTYLLDLMVAAPPVVTANDYAEIIIDHSIRHALRDAGATIADLAWRERDRDVVEIALEAEKLVVDIARSGGSKDAWSPVGEAVWRGYERAKAGKGPPGVMTGLSELDEILGGFRPATLNIIAGRPGAGKSAAGVQIALNVARRGLGVGFFSLEMPEEQCSGRFASSVAYDRRAAWHNGVPPFPTFSGIERGDLTHLQWEAYERAAKAIEDLPIAFDYRSRLTVSQMTAAARRLIRAWERQGVQPGAFIVDHFLHIAAEKGARGEAAERYTTICNDLMHMAKSLSAPVILLCQLNRGVESREDKRPTMADLKWTGALEENSFSVTFLYRPAYYLKPPVDSASQTEEQRRAAWKRYDEEKGRVANQLFWLVEKNRGGVSNKQVETFCDIAFNAIQDLGVWP